MGNAHRYLPICWSYSSCWNLILLQLPLLLLTGRAIYILTQTLPQFFETGLVDSVDLQRPVPVTSSLLSTSSWNGYAGNSRIDDSGELNDESTSIYASNIRLEYTPPMTLPPPFPRMFWAQGEYLYCSLLYTRN
jgi:hypothetical protein